MRGGQFARQGFNLYDEFWGKRPGATRRGRSSKPTSRSSKKRLRHWLTTFPPGIQALSDLIVGQAISSIGTILARST